MERKQYRIAQFGTYDIESFGDSLFPTGLRFGLAERLDFEVELFSMNECAEPYNGNSHVYSFGQFPERHEASPFDLVVLGGGEFLHFKPISFMVDGKKIVYPRGYLWQEPVRMAKERGIPTVLNCVGAPHDFTAKEQKELAEVLNSLALVTVRDEFSAKRLRAAGVKCVTCAADHLWYLGRMFPSEECAETRRRLEEETGRNYTDPYLVVQYGTTRDLENLAKCLLEIGEKSGCRIYLMSVNYCHEDRVGMERLWALGEGKFELISDYFQPKEIVAVISGAKGFFGTSLHGNLTAASYGVPFIGIDMYPSFVSKMDGIFTMMGCEKYLCPSADSVSAAWFDREKDADAADTVAENINQMQEKLDRHFEQMARLLKGEV